MKNFFFGEEKEYEVGRTFATVHLPGGEKLEYFFEGWISPIGDHFYPLIWSSKNAFDGWMWRLSKRGFIYSAQNKAELPVRCIEKIDVRHESFKIKQRT